MSFVNNRIAKSGGGFLLLAWMILQAPSAWPQASWVGDVIVDGEPSNLWADCLPCTAIDEPPNTNWSTDRIPGDDGPLGDPGTGAVIGPDFVVDHNGGTLDLSTLDVQGALIVGGLINISDSATINNIDLESGGALDAGGPVTLSGTGTWNGVITGGSDVTNSGTLSAVTGNLRGHLVNDGTIDVSPSIDFGGGPGRITNNSGGKILLPDDHNILDGSSSGFLFNAGSIEKTGNGQLSVIESAGEHAGGSITVRQGAILEDNVLRFFRNGWLFSGGSMHIENDATLELSGNAVHTIDGLGQVSGAGVLLFRMSTFGQAVVSAPLTVGSGIALSGIGVRIDADMTWSPEGLLRDGTWDAGRLEGTGTFSIDSIFDEFRIIAGGGKRLGTEMRNLDGSTAEVTDSIVIDSSGRLENRSGATMHFIRETANLEINGTGELVNSGLLSFQDTDTIVRPEFSNGDMAAGIRPAEMVLADADVTLRGGGAWQGDSETRIGGTLDIEADGPSVLRFSSGIFSMDGDHKFQGDNLTGPNRLLIEGTAIIRVNSGRLIFFMENDSEVVMNAGSLEGPGDAINGANFLWNGGSIGLGSDSADTLPSSGFFNSDSAALSISTSAKQLDGRLFNAGEVIAGAVNLSSDARIINDDDWIQIAGDLTGAGLFENRQFFFAGLGGSQSVACDFDNAGEVIVNDGLLEFTGEVAQLVGNSLVGGNWTIGPGGAIAFPAIVSELSGGAQIIGVDGISGAEALSTINNASAAVTGDLALDDALSMSDGSILGIGAETALEVPGGVQNGASGDHTSVIASRGETLVIASKPKPPDARVTAFASAGKAAASGTQTPLLTTPLLNNHAILAPGGIGLPGSFNLDGELVMHPGSTLDIDIAGATPVAGHDQLFVTGPMTLAGVLQITVAEDFFPAVGQPFVIARADGGIAGTMDGVTAINREDIVWSMFETAEEVMLQVADVERIFDNGFEAR